MEVIFGPFCTSFLRVNLVSIIAIARDLRNTIVSAMHCQMPSQTLEILRNTLTVRVVTNNCLGCDLTIPPSCKWSHSPHAFSFPSQNHHLNPAMAAPSCSPQSPLYVPPHVTRPLPQFCLNVEPPSFVHHPISIVGEFLMKPTASQCVPGPPLLAPQLISFLTVVRRNQTHLRHRCTSVAAINSDAVGEPLP